MLVCATLLLVCGSIYYFSYTNRTANIRTRLTNRAITTARLLTQYDIFNQGMIQKIDSATAISLQRKVVLVYDEKNQLMYGFSDEAGDSIRVIIERLKEVRESGNVYYRDGARDVVAHNFKNNGTDVVVFASAFDFDGNKTLADLRLILGLCFVGGIIVAVGAGYIFSTELLVPVKKIADEVNEISAQSLTERLKITSARDEWNYLARTLNELLNRLQDSFENQRRFVSNASHELSTPLTSISSQLEVSLQRPRDADEYRTIMQSVYQDVRHLSSLTQTLLEFATASGGTGGLVIESVRIDEIILGLPADLLKQDKKFAVMIDFSNLPAEEEKLLVSGNEDLLHTAIKNIVVNACKYSDNLLARLSLGVADSDVIISIENNGKGIAPEELGNIFQPFYRTEDSRHIDGFGLGLALANRIIKLHRGFVTVSSKPGSTVFTIRLPNSEKEKVQI